jgi:hypothetical protein
MELLSLPGKLLLSPMASLGQHLGIHRWETVYCVHLQQPACLLGAGSRSVHPCEYTNGVIEEVIAMRRPDSARKSSPEAWLTIFLTL